MFYKSEKIHELFYINFIIYGFRLSRILYFISEIKVVMKPKLNYCVFGMMATSIIKLMFRGS